MNTAGEFSESSLPFADRILIQRNPTSGSGRGATELRKLIRELRAMRYRVRLFARRENLDEFLSRPDVKATVTCLVAAGGDGTVASLAHRHSEYPIAVLPLGTENLVARHLKIPRCGRTVAEMIKQNKVKYFDTGFVNDQRFLVMVSAGVDAEVVRRLSTIRTGNISRLSYVWPIVQSFFRYRFSGVEVHGPDGQLLASGSHVIISNMPEYGFRMPFCPEADPTDGRLDVRVFRSAGATASLLHAIRTRLGLSDSRRDVARFCLTEVHLRSDSETVPVQFDGDPTQYCPVSVTVAPKSMKLIVRE